MNTNLRRNLPLLLLLGAVLLIQALRPAPYMRLAVGGVLASIVVVNIRRRRLSE